MTPDLDEPCLGFLKPRQLGRLPISMVVERVFLFFEVGLDVLSFLDDLLIHQTFTLVLFYVCHSYIYIYIIVRA